MSAASTKLAVNTIEVAKGGEEYEWYNFNIRNIRFGKPESKTSEATGLPYSSVKIEYNYAKEGESPKWKPFKINAPRQRATYGVSAFEEKEGDNKDKPGAAPRQPKKITYDKDGNVVKPPPNYSLASPIDFTNPEQDRFADIIHEVYVLLAIYLSLDEIYEKTGVVVNLPWNSETPIEFGNWDHFAKIKREISPKRPVGGIFYPLKFGKIKGTTQNDYNTPLKMTAGVKFVKEGEKGFSSKFTDCPPKDSERKPTVIPLDILSSNSFDHITMYDLSSAYIGSQASIQKKVLTSIMASRPVPLGGNNISFQGSAYKRLQAEQTDDEVNDVNDAIAALMLKSMGKTAEAAAAAEPAPATSSTSTPAPAPQAQPQLTYQPPAPANYDNNHEAIRAMMMAGMTQPAQQAPAPAPVQQVQQAPMELPPQPAAFAPPQFQYVPPAQPPMAQPTMEMPPPPMSFAAPQLGYPVPGVTNVPTFQVPAEPQAFTFQPVPTAAQ